MSYLGRTAWNGTKAGQAHLTYLLDFGLAYGPTTRHSGGLPPFFLLSERADDGRVYDDDPALAWVSSPPLAGEWLLMDALRSNISLYPAAIRHTKYEEDERSAGAAGHHSKFGVELTRGRFCEEVRLALDKHAATGPFHYYQIWSGQSETLRLHKLMQAPLR